MMIATWSFNEAKTDTLTGGLTVGGDQRFSLVRTAQILGCFGSRRTGASLGLPVEPPTVAGSSREYAMPTAYATGRPADYRSGRGADSTSQG